jgi:hypothetical protein
VDAARRKCIVEQDRPAPSGAGIDAYYRAVTALREGVFSSQRPLLTAVAQRMADVIRAGGRAFVIGTGHSHMLAEEGDAHAGRHRSKEKWRGKNRA